MNVKSFFAIFLCIISYSISYGMTCKDSLTKLPFWSATIQANAVFCTYAGSNDDGTRAANAYYIMGKFQPDLGDWKINNRYQYSCLDEDGMASKCQFIPKS